MDGAVDEQKNTQHKQASMGSSGTDNALQIYCRLRPAEKSAPKETEDEVKQAEDVATLERKSDTTLALRRPNSFLEQQYLFEHVFDGDASQQSVFERAAMPLIESLLAGQDGLIFAYGATGSGKSFTVGGQPDKPGIVPCTIDYLFEVLASHLNVECHIQSDNQNHYIVNHRFSSGKVGPEDTDTADDEKQLVGEWTKRVRSKKTSQLSPATLAHISSRRYNVFVSFVEIYNNYIYDLLEQPDPSVINWRRAPHQLRQDARKTVFVYGASEVPAKNADQAMHLFLYGLQNRQTAATRLNQCSSRSHSVFTLKVVSYDEAKLGGQLLNENQLTVNQFSIVDLAGVERTSRTKVTGALLAEANSINNSLLTLRNCFEVMRANQAAKQPKPIPFRTHKLTFLLKSFFERRSSLIRMIICVKPTIEDVDDNIQVLGFGQKAQEIVLERQVPDTTELGTEEKEESGSAGQMQFALTRFGGCLLDEQQLEDGSFDSGKFIQEMEQYLETHKRESEAMLRLSLQTVQELSDNLKFYPVRQAHRQSKPVAGYSLKLTGLVTAKLLPLYQGKSGRQSSCCLHRLTSIAGTPIVMPRQPGPTLIDRSKELALQELSRELSSWESAFIDIKGKLNSQVHDLRLYIDKVVLKVAPSHPGGKLDVFTRLYNQTPTRYKVKAITGQASAKGSSRLVSTSKVSQLKRLFTPPEPAKVTLPSGSGRKLVMSSKIKSLCNQLITRDPNLVSKLASSAERNGNLAAPKSRRNLTKTKLF